MFKDLKVLYVEDEDFIRETTKESLEFMSINVVTANDGEEAYQKYLEFEPDVMITDIEMPKLNGLQLIEKIRRDDKKIQIIVTTAYEHSQYLLKAIELHLVKYLLKPIHITELKNALQLCVDNLKGGDKLKYFNDNSFYDINKHILVVNDSEVKLDFHEIQFLELLLKYSNQIVSYEQIENIVFDSYMDMASLRTLVKKLRQKLPENVIENISKMGYKAIVCNT